MTRLLAIAWTLWAPAAALAQTVVLPERPGQNRVAWYDFDWHRYDVPPPGGGPGGIGLYYYRREREVAERALPVIRSAFVRLVDEFHYSPTKVIPYILYSSKREFQSTNVFQVSESVLGVTSPKDLRMSLPYFGDQEKFREVSTHELVHQFTIQKLLDVAGTDYVGSLVDALPLWFIEGIAEFYAKGGLDPETEVFLRDLVWNPDPEKRYEVVSFAEDRIRGYIATYKLGQARVAFVAEVYGKEKIQGFLEAAYAAGSPAGAYSSERGFAALVRRVLNEDLPQVDARWRAWLKRRYYAEYLRIRQDMPQVRPIPDAPDEIEAYAASPDGNTVLAREIDRERGRVHLYLLDPRFPGSAVEVVGDNQPGVESLHPLDQSILAISDRLLAFSAQDGAQDSVYVQAYRRSSPGGGKPSSLSLGRRIKIPLGHPSGLHFIEVSDLAFSQDSSHLAFVALTEAGSRDVYVAPVRGGMARQLTDDPFDERDLHWGQDGIYCSSDATDHGRFNLFRLDAGSGSRTRLTTTPSNDRHPRPQADGSVVYSSDSAGKPDLYHLKDGLVRRVTDFSTGLSSPSPSPGARGIYAQTFHRGRFRLVEVPRAAWLEEPPLAVAEPPGPPQAIPADSIPEQTPSYRSTALSNWRAESGFVAAGGGSGSYGGRAAVLFADILRDRVLLVDLAILGSLDYTQGQIVYLDRSGRITWALGASHFVDLQVDRLDPNLTFFQREFGVSGELRFPLDRYRRFDAELTLGGISRYCLTDFLPAVVLSCQGIQVPHARYPDDAAWRSLNGGVNPVVTPAFRFGYDNVRYDAFTGPIDGTSILLEVGGSWLPTRHAVSGYGKADMAHWWRLVGKANLMLRLAGGASFAPDDNGRVWAKSWWVSASDNLRGFSPFDQASLVGQNYYVGNLELQLPLEWLVRLLFFDYLEGVVALDFGGVFNRWRTERDPDTGRILELGAWDSRTLTGVLGVNALFGPLLLRVHFGHPYDIGGQTTPAQAEHATWVTNVSLRWFFF